MDEEELGSRNLEVDFFGYLIVFVEGKELTDFLGFSYVFSGI